MENNAELNRIEREIIQQRETAEAHLQEFKSLKAQLKNLKEDLALCEGPEERKPIRAEISSVQAKLDQVDKLKNEAKSRMYAFQVAKTDYLASLPQAPQQ